MDRVLRNMKTIRTWLPFVAAVLVGALLRGHQLDPQILVDDEWHSLNRDLRLAYWLPSVVYFAAEATVGLSDRMIHGFFWGFGVFLTVALPAAARRFVGWQAAAVYAWLLALSPFLVYYSRFARPYALALFLSVAAVVWFLLWWETRRAVFAAAYVVAATAALSVHPLMATFVFCPFVYRLAALIATPERRLKELRALAPLGLCVSVCTIVPLAPLFYDFALISNTGGQSSRELSALVEVFGTYFGTHGPMVLPMAALACAGFLSMLRTAPALCWNLLLGSILQIASIFVTAPAGASSAFILARYTIPVLPFALLLAATGIAGLGEGLAARIADARMRSWTRVLVPGIVLATLFATGPLRGSYRRPNSWFTSEMHLKLTRMQGLYRQSVHGVSPFYQELGEAEPGSVTLIEAPWYSEVHRNPYPFYQGVHSQRVLIGFPGAGFDYLWRQAEENHFESRRFVSLANTEELKARGDFLVIHKNLAAEMTPLIANHAFDRPAPWGDSLERLISTAGDRFGEPFFEDEQLVVFRLAE